MGFFVPYNVFYFFFLRETHTQNYVYGSVLFGTQELDLPREAVNWSDTTEQPSSGWSGTTEQPSSLVWSGTPFTVLTNADVFRFFFPFISVGGGVLRLSPFPVAG